MSLSKPRPILNDMPYHIKKMIVESIPSFLDRLPLRKVSKEFMRIVDTAKVELTIGIYHKTVTVRRGISPNDERVKEHATITEAIDHFKWFVSKQNVTFVAIIITGDQPFCVELLEMLTATVYRPLRVKRFGMIGGGQARILEFIEPGTLEHVGLCMIDQEEAESVFRTEQWRHAKDVLLNGISAACEVWWDIPRFIILHNHSINLTDLPKILEHLSNSDTFVCGKIFKTWTIEAIVEAFGGDGWQWKESATRFSEKEFSVRRHGFRIVVQAYENMVEFELKQSE